MHSGLDSRSQRAAQFVSQLLFGQEYDHLIKQAVRHQQSLEELLEHSTIEKTWKVIIAAADDAPGTLDVDVEEAASKSMLLNQFMEPEVLSKLQQPEHKEKLKTVEHAAELARRQAKAQIQTVDGTLSLEKLCKLLRSMDMAKLKGGAESSFLVIYSVECAGEHEKDSRRSATPQRRDHMEKVLHSVMTIRGDSMPEFDDLDKITWPQMDPSDVSLGSFVTDFLEICHFAHSGTCSLMGGVVERKLPSTKCFAASRVLRNPSTPSP